MGLTNWWNDRENEAQEFLKTGTYNDTVRNRPSYSDDGNTTYNQCTSSSQCGYGFACVGGQCVRMDAGGNNGQVNYPGQCDSNDPNAPCNAGGPNSCQQAPTPCGGGDFGGDARDCCGKRCCSFGSASSTRPGVHCYCGDCPPWPTCSTFCESYLKANGEPGPGCSEGTEGNSCDQCSYCQSGDCKPLTSGAPCWCEGGNDCAVADCHRCQTDPKAAGFGGCQFDAEGCQECATITNHLCPCNVMLGPVTVCKPYGSGGLLAINLAQQEAARQCEEACKGPDPCAAEGAKVKRCCFEDYGDCTFPSCDSPGTAGSTQIDSSVDENGYGCVTCQFAADLSDHCKECDCNCHDDCPDCQLCGADGTCQTDPLCDICGEGKRVCQDLETCCDAEETCTPIYSNIFITGADGEETAYSSIGAPADWSIVPANGETPYCENVSPTRDRLLIENHYFDSLPPCEYPNGEPRYIAFADSQCYGPGTDRPDITPFTPVFKSATVVNMYCCDLREET